MQRFSVSASASVNVNASEGLQYEQSICIPPQASRPTETLSTSVRRVNCEMLLFASDNY